MSIRIKRLIAFVTDWIISFIPIMFIFSFIVTFFMQESEENPFVFILCFSAVLLAFAVFILRDVIFKGRSLGKQLFGLYIYDKSSLNPASKKQCFLRNLFFFLYFIDVILLLVTGQTIGDRAAGTIVTNEESPDACGEARQYAQPVDKKLKIKKAVSVIAIIIACLTAFTGLIQLLLTAQKNSEEYKVAYSYFTESRAFQELDTDESEIRFNHYSLNTYTSEKCNCTSRTAEIGFLVKSEAFEVICHDENGVWQVCNECTLFE